MKNDLKLLDGNPGHRAVNRSEPKFTGIPTCPKHLTKPAKAEWKRIADELSAQGLLTTVDRAALAGYCASWSRWVDAEENIQRFGSVIKSPKSGFPIQNPFVGIANTALTMLLRFAVEFGFTPSSRTKLITSNLQTSGDPFTDFMATLGAEDITTHDEETALQQPRT